MATILDDEDTIEAQALSTSLDPYGQLIKMLMPRALGIAIYDRTGTPLWLSDGCEGPDVPQLVEESLAAARSGNCSAGERDGFARPWGGETAYVFILRDAAQVLGALAVACQDGQNGSRPFSLVQGLLRPALQVLGRELSSQSSIGDLRRDLTVREGDLELLLDAGVAAGESDADDLEQVLRIGAGRLQAAFGALLVPDRQIVISHPHAAGLRVAESELLEKTQRNLFAWVQVQRRTLILNRIPPSSPLGTLPYKMLAAPVRERTQDVVGLVVLFRALSARDFEVREARVLETVTRHIGQVLQNTYDPATGLLTRAALEQKALALVAAARTTAEHWVAYGDVDRMHAVNDKHGMHVGDQVIESVGAAIRSALADDVMAAKVAGDRFVLFFRDMHAEAVRAFLTALLRKIEGIEFTHQGQQLDLSVSFGVAPVTGSRLPLSHALAGAESACKVAKQGGRGGIEVYGDAPRAAVRRRNDAEVLSALRHAIANDRFRMDAQPIVDLSAGNGRNAPPRRFELLLRMIDAAGESVAPDKFLLAAERNQLATAIDRWVVQYALEILSSAAPMLESIGAHFTINISGQALAEEEFASFLEQKLGEYALPATLLSFEVSESAAVANIVRAQALIHRVRDMGHTIALDDFGRGLSSLTYLKSLSASHLKIDGALVRDLVDNARAQTMVRAIVQFARASQLKTTAECVESEAILHAVTGLGVDFGQGFALGRPRTLEGVLQELLRAAAPTDRLSGAGRISRVRD